MSEESLKELLGKVKYITDADGRRKAVIDEEDLNRFVEDYAEDLADTAYLDEEMSKDHEYVTLDEVEEKLRGQGVR